MPNWMRSDDGKKEEQKEIELKPENFVSKEDFAPVKDGVAAMTAFIAEQQKIAKEEKDAKEAAETARRNKDRNEELDDPTAWLDNPRQAMQREMRPLVESQLRTNAELVKRNTLERMDYYSSDPNFKSAVDEYIAKQPLQIQSNPEVVLNAYKVVLYDKQAEIKEGKIKSQESINSHGRNASSEKEEKSGYTPETLSATEREYISKLGIKETDYIKQKAEMEFV